MDGRPVTVRLLDPPLHEFLPDFEKLVKAVAKLEADASADQGEVEAKRALLADVQALHESNPMMGLRGVRVSLIKPQILRMQVCVVEEQQLLILISIGFDSRAN